MKRNAMQVAIHTGVHATDSDQLLKTLLRNRDVVRSDGVAVPGPGKYRKLMSEMLNALGPTRPAPDAGDILLDSVLDEDSNQVDRLVFCHENLFSVPKIAFQGGRVYRKAEQRLENLAYLFGERNLELFISVRNPATFLPALLNATPHNDLDALLCGLDPFAVRWSEFVGRVSEALPGVPITVWCDEDSPLVWGEVVREMTGIAPMRPLVGAYSRLAEIMTKEGMTRFRGYVADHPDLTEVQIRRVMVAFLDKFADPGKMENEVDIPGWSEDYIAELTDQYEDDVYELGRLPGVTLISP